MAEVTLPGEELTPEVPVVVLEKPGINSKVIEVIFDPLNTKKTTVINTSESFFTTDTDAWLEFTATGLTNATGTYSLVLRNRYDGSVFQHVGDMVDGKAYYKMPAQEIRHAGRWVAQMYATLENGDSTGAQFGFSVEGHLLDGADVREVVVEDFKALMAQLEAIKGQAETDLTSLKADLSLSTTEAQQLIADTNELKLVYDELLETGVLQTNINGKLTELETTYAPRLTTLEQNDVSLTAQLQQTEQSLNAQLAQTDGRIDTILVSGTPTEGNTMLLDGAVSASGVNHGSVGTNLRKTQTGEAILPKAIKADHLTIISPASDLNIFNPYTTTDGFRLTSTGGVLADANYTLSDYIPVTTGKTYRIITGGASTSRICGYVADKTFLEIVTAGVAKNGVITVDFTGFIRVPVPLSNKFTTQIVDSDIYNGLFTPFEYVISDAVRAKPKKNSVENDTIKEGVVSYRKTDFITNGKNLFNPDKITLDLLLADLVNVAYYTTEYIPVVSGVTYTINECRRYELYDGGKIRIGLTVEKPDNDPVTFTASADGFLRASFNKNFLNTLQIEVGSAVTSYERFQLRMKGLVADKETVGVEQLNPQLYAAVFQGGNLVEKLGGKILLNIGDSIGTGAGNNNFGYAHMIAAQYGMILHNKAGSGATITNVLENNNIQAQLALAIAEGIVPDVVFVEGGTNDINALYDVGTVTPDYETALDRTTFCGGLEWIFKTIHETFPEAIILYITPHHMRKSLAKMTEVFAKGVEISGKYGIPVVNLYREGLLNTRYINMSALYTQDTYASGEGDGTHPNEAGYRKFYVPPITAKLATLV